MSKLIELTKEQERLMPIVRDEWINLCLHNSDFNEDECRKGVEWLYELCNLGKPEMIVVDSPRAAQLKANELMGRKPEDYIYEPFASEGAISSAGWVAFYDFFQRINIALGPAEENLNRLKALIKSGPYDMIQLTDVCIVVKKHESISLLNGRLHNIDGPCIRWSDGFELYAINGRIRESWIWKDKENHTLERFMAQNNEEDRAAMIAVLGGEKAIKLFGAELVSTDHKNKETYRLWKTKERFAAADNEKLAWVEVVCPSTNTHYYIDVHPKWKTALEAVASTWPGETAETYTIAQHT